jgi:Cys-tRNA(Pro)/Cys-tRNA(Cys) deacylase
MPKKAAGGTPATVALTRAGVEFTVRDYDHDPRATSYGLEAAEALGVDAARVFKTLMAEVDGRLVVGVVPVTGHLDLKALARAVGGRKAQMADPAAAERATGYVVGGISPVGQKRPHPTVVDESAPDRARLRRAPRARRRALPHRPGRGHRRDDRPGRASLSPGP